MKNKILSIIFVFILFVFLILNFITKDSDISLSERRKLKQFPKVTIKSLLDSSFFKEVDEYSTDQMVYRNKFREIKSFFSTKILNNYDFNNMYEINNNIFKIEYPLNSNAIRINNNKLNSIYNKYLMNNKVYYSIIPDKNYFVNDKYLKIDYDKMFLEINKGLSNFNYIDISNVLSLDDYYLTDPHWKQDKLSKVVKVLLNDMNNDYYDFKYNKNVFNNFCGSFHNQAASNIPCESLSYYNNKILDEASLYNIESTYDKVYNENKLMGIDPYDVFLSGSSAYEEISNNNAYNNKELVIFRDSFGSSIAPLLIPFYRKIILIDIRYINSDLLNKYIDFNNQDVLFLYSTLIYNTNILK
ncbi:MAG: hypothetical protein RR228_00495 [Bacilli bacterium]